MFFLYLLGYRLFLMKYFFLFFQDADVPGPGKERGGTV